jgi:uncharacterized circularly permuted ATP-grasp superfamily protein/uncharacterized alpha-E superfamily protein
MTAGLLSAAGVLGRAYAPPPGGADELLGPDGRPRPHWRPFLDSLAGLGPEEFFRRWAEARDVIRANGVTYNVYGDPQGHHRPWQLDPLPVLVAPEAAAATDAGLRQRARLLERLLADLYGPRELVRPGLLPPELVYANPRFLRPCQGLPPPAGRHLHLYAADVGRSADGTLHVLRDRTQAPSGAGYALENRIVLARMLPEAFRDCRVQRMALFFRTLRDSLRAAAPHNRDNPRVVLLTPGPYNESYFEHAFLARYLGYTLAEGGDLTVRDGRVFLKLLGGLQPVDVILRRLDDDYCDPLELRPDSFLGVPGLVQAVRLGHVAVANALGSGVLESPALAPHLPALCRHVLGEDLRLPTVPTWWCGDPASLSHVLTNLPRLVVKSAFPAPRSGPVFAASLAKAERESLADRVRARPTDFVAQEQLALSTVPVTAGDRLEPRRLVTRVFLAASSSEDFVVMPGGLSRVGATPGALTVSMQTGGGSKDTWVLSSGTVSDFSLLRPAGQPLALNRGGNDLPSRSADNLFWLGRYVERAEGQVRLLRGILTRLAEKSGVGEAPELPALLRALALQTRALPAFLGPGAEERLASPEAELLALVYDRRKPGGLAAVLEGVERVAATARDRLSPDMWRALHGLRIDDAPAGRTAADVLDLLDRAVVTLAAVGGLAADSMTRGQAWAFLEMGRRLERALSTVALLKGTLAPPQPAEPPVLEAVLEIADSLMTYRRRYLGTLQVAPVIDLLLADESNPRSVAFQLVALAEGVARLPRDPGQAVRPPEERLSLAALTAVRLAEVVPLAVPDSAGGRPLLAGLLSRLEADLPELSDALTLRYLSHLQPSRQLAALGPERTP